MKIIITLTLFVITTILSIFGIKKSDGANTIFHQKNQIEIVQIKNLLNNEVKK